MKCEKCGHQNIAGFDICGNCKAPLAHKTNEERIHLKKGKHIDIEDIAEEKEQPSFNQTKRSVRNFLLFLLLTIIIGVVWLLGVLLIDKFSQAVFKEYEDIMKHSSLGLIYLGYDEEIDEKCTSYSENYGFDYLNIEANKISLSKKKKLRKELNIYNLTSTLVIVQDGVPVAYYSKLSSTDELLEFLQNNKLVPEIIGDTTDSLETFEKLIGYQEETIIYLPTIYDDKIEQKSETIKGICEENGLEYGEVKGYLFSQKQLKNVMSRIGFSEIQDDLIIYVREGKIVDILEVKEIKESDYFHLFSNRGIIDITSGDYLTNISKSKFSKIVEEKEMNVVFIGSDNCLYCDRVRPILGKIANQNNLDIYYLDATNDKENVSSIIKEIGYDEGLTITPFVLIVENGKYVDSVIGLADKDLYINKFIEYGVIK